MPRQPNQLNIDSVQQHELIEYVFVLFIEGKSRKSKNEKQEFLNIFLKCYSRKITVKIGIIDAK